MICDDCSTDDSVRIIKKYVDKDERIVLLKNQVNSGLAATLNKYIRRNCDYWSNHFGVQ